ncbi:MAG: thymidylate kinase [bacterium]|nr:thymidylate kinase [bacterium]
MRGKLIVIDGSDGVGKKTQTALLVERLRKERLKVRTLDFPQYAENFFGSFIRECLDGEHGSFTEASPYFASIPYAADRFESKPRLEKWLAEGALVVLDRYVSANQMHQGGKIKGTANRERFLEWLDTMEHKIFKLPRPDLIIYLHIPVSLSLALISGRGRKDQHENDPTHLENSQESALELIKERGRWRRVECAKDKEIFSREEIHEKVYALVKKVILK